VLKFHVMNSPEALNETLEEIKEELAKLAATKRSRRTESEAKSAGRRTKNAEHKAPEEVYQAKHVMVEVPTAEMLFERQDSASNDNNDTTDETAVYAKKE
jgi:hypothetical protein